MREVALFVVVGLVAMLLAFPLMWSWNFAVVAALTVAKPIGYWHAVVLMWLPLHFADHTGSKKE